LVQKAHQQNSLKALTRFSSDFLQSAYSSAMPKAPNLTESPNDSSAHLVRK
jgi:hypothetical protein